MVNFRSFEPVRRGFLLLATVSFVIVSAAVIATRSAAAADATHVNTLGLASQSATPLAAPPFESAKHIPVFSMPSASSSDAWSPLGDASSPAGPKPSAARHLTSIEPQSDSSFDFSSQQPLWKVLLHHLPQWLSKLKDVIINLLILIGLFSLVAAFWWEWRRNVVVIDALEVPKDLTEKGFSGVVLAQRLADEIYSIQRVVKNKAEETGVEIGGMQTDFQVPAANLSLKTLVRYVRQVFKRNEMRIRGEVTTQGDKYSLQLRTSNGRATSTRPAKTTKEFDRLLKTGAEDVILLAAPTLAMQYRFLDEFNCLKFPRTLEAVKFYLSTTRRRQHKFAYTVWGNLLAVTDDFDGAIEKYKTALSIDSAYSPAYNGWGNALRRRQEFDAAIAKYRDAIRFSKKYDVAMINLGLVFLDKKEPKVASRWFAKALKLNPVSPSASLNLGMSKRDIGQTDEALRYIRQSLDVDPNFAAGYLQLAITLRRKLRRKDAISAIKKGLALGFPMPNLYAVWGDILFDTSEFLPSIEKYEEALRSSSDYVFAKLGKARCLARLKEFDAAISQAKSAIEQAPRLWQAPIVLGDIYLEMRRFGDARTQFTKALQIDGGEASAHIELARIDEALYEYDSASERLLKALAAEPTSTSAHALLGRIRLAKHQSSGAMESFTNAHELDEYAILSVCGLGDCYRYRLDLDESLNLYSSAIEMDDLAIAPLLGAAKTLYALNRLPEALTAFNDALGIDSKNITARVGRIDTLRRLGVTSASDAWAEARDLVEETPEQPVAYVAIGNLALDESIESTDVNLLLHAMSCFECALARDPQQPDAHFSYARAEVLYGYPDEAVKRLVALNEQNKFYIGAYLLRAHILLNNLGRPSEAWEVFRFAATVAPENPQVYFDWGRALKAHALTEEAVAALESAAELAPNHYPITALLSELRTSLYGKLGQKAEATN